MKTRMRWMPAVRVPDASQRQHSARPTVSGAVDAARWHHGGMPRDWHLERYPGKYVAIDMATDEVVLTADTPHELHELIQAQGLRNVATMRAPTEDEPLFVGTN